MRRYVCGAVMVALTCAAPAATAQDDVAPLRVAVVVEIAPPPLLEADGRPVGNAAARVRELAAALDAISRADVPYTLSVSPVFVDQLRQLAATGARAYAALLRLTGDRPVLSRPYADAALARIGDADEVRAEIARGIDALSDPLDVTPIRVLHPPGLDIDESTITAARLEGLDAILVDAGAVPSRQAGSNGIALVGVDTTSGSDTGRLVERMNAAGRDAVAVVAPPGARLARRLAAMAGDERVEAVALRELVGNFDDTVVREQTVDAPPREYVRAIAEADRALTHLASYTLADNRTRETLSVLLGIARSTVHWQRTGRWNDARDRARAVVLQVRQERDLISAASDTVTLTARRGTVPITVRNLASYPVRLRVEVTSARLTFPDGPSKVATISPRGGTVTFLAETKATGTFPLTVRLTAPGGGPAVDRAEILVRSTATNVAALVLTLGAALFLMGWYALGFVRRRSRA